MNYDVRRYLSTGLEGIGENFPFLADNVSLVYQDVVETMNSARVVIDGIEGSEKPEVLEEVDMLIDTLGDDYIGTDINAIHMSLLDDIRLVYPKCSTIEIRPVNLQDLSQCLGSIMEFKTLKRELTCLKENTLDTIASVSSFLENSGSSDDSQDILDQLAEIKKTVVYTTQNSMILVDSLVRELKAIKKSLDVYLASPLAITDHEV